MSYRPFYTRVHSSTLLSPHFLRIVLSGEDLADCGREEPHFDRRIKIVLPGANGQLPQLGSCPQWYQSWCDLPEDERGFLRTYSIRDLTRTEDGTFLTIDFVLHLAPGASGPAAQWAQDAQPGDPLIIIGPTADAEPGSGIEFDPGAATSLRIYGDETAAPAIARILEDVPSNAQGEALIEVPTAEDQLLISAPPGVTVTWLPRDGAQHGEKLLQSILGAPAPADAIKDSTTLLWETPKYSASGEQIGAEKQASDAPYYWIAGESGVVTALRRHLVKEQGVSRSQVSFMGYWKRDARLRG